ncbi:hypothetical protein OCAR_7130 [Afipia carboxidovorans OM5]|nr:hypothetical protein OCAR_7130 [Afipia carboxidovorans OM5]
MSHRASFSPVAPSFGHDHRKAWRLSRLANKIYFICILFVNDISLKPSRF